jgi:hypothetical protein
VESSPDITVKVALFEDSAAVVGLVFAAPATMTVRRVASCPLRFFTGALLARAAGIKRQRDL